MTEDRVEMGGPLRKRGVVLFGEKFFGNFNLRQEYFRLFVLNWLGSGYIFLFWEDFSQLVGDFWDASWQSIC